MSELLKKARKYEEEMMAKESWEDRPRFHVTGGIGWINDPNGFSMYQGEYHLFYQYHPYSVQWGPMHWGHVKSEDLITWKRLPIALAPDMPFDHQGCFSGSALTDEQGNHVLIYTGVSEVNGVSLQRQCIAFGDGVTYEKAGINPVADGSLLPEGFSVPSFRDPKVWKENDRYRMIVGNRTEERDGAVQLFESGDLLHWEHVSTPDQSKGEIGEMWECPDYFELDGKKVLLLSPTNMKKQGNEFEDGHNTAAIIGTETDEDTLKRETVQCIDYGIDFYAPQTMLSEDGRRIMIAWMQSWDTSRIAERDKNWFACMTLPRVLEVKNGKLVQNPVDEIRRYYADTVKYDHIPVKEKRSFEGAEGPYADLSFLFESAEEKLPKFVIHVNEKDGYSAKIAFDPSENAAVFDRTGCRTVWNMKNSRIIPVSCSQSVKVRMILDRGCLEIFFNDGEQAASFRIYDEDFTGVSVEAESRISVSAELHHLKF